MFSKIANACGAPVAVLRQVPNQPLYGDKTEDTLIAYTFQQFFETKDNSWPLLLPMVKSAVKGMDTIQEFCGKEFGQKIEKFVVSGGSKRGWTTWLTGAADSRVSAIAPMVIDVLNMSPQMDYQLEAWGEYSEQINDYTELDLPKRMKEPEGQPLLAIVDPYSYRSKLTMPKLIFIGTNDPYWPVDAVKWYFKDLVGESYIHYVPNVGHGLGDGKQAVRALAAFFALSANGSKHPSIHWSVSEKENHIQFRVTGDKNVKNVNLWNATSPIRDFRKRYGQASF